MKKKILLISLLFSLVFNLCYAQKNKVVLLISEQNISGPQRSWWASEVDLSITESTVAKKLMESGFVVLEPSFLNKIIKQDKAFRKVNISEEKSKKLGSLAKADYVVLGKAIASQGGNVPQSNMRSCFANITAKLIRVKDGKVLAYLDSSGSSVHLDAITAGKEALVNAGGVLAEKIVEALNKEGGK